MLLCTVVASLIYLIYFHLNRDFFNTLLDLVFAVISCILCSPALSDNIHLYNSLLIKCKCKRMFQISFKWFRQVAALLPDGRIHSKNIHLTRT